MDAMNATSSKGRACVFLDRDGTLNVDVGYAHRPDQLVLVADVASSLAALRRAGLLLIVVTNQSGVARGFYSEAELVRFHECLDQELGPEAAPDAYYYCPYHPDALVPAYRQDSPLRKPDIGMFERARADFPIDVQRSFMIGDTSGDMEFARRAGLRAILVAPKTGEVESSGAPHCYLRRPDFAAAARTVLDLHVCGRDAWCGDTTPSSS